jgi:S-adenosylmethionine synthetase
MPLPITLAHRLTRRLETVRQSGECPFLRPDGKAQVTVAYDGQRRAQTVTAVVLSAQHHPDIGQDALKSALKQAVITPVLGDLITAETVFHINPTGSFVVGGPQGDAGLTGRKIIVDTYGGSCPHGGGAFSGKDATKVDRTGAYAARHIAKNIVAAGLAERCQVQVSYAIGVAEPVSLLIESFGTGEVDDRLLEKAVLTLWDLRPAALIRQLDLKQPVFQKTASGGHFGRPEFAWESLTHVPRLKAYFA